MGDTAFWIGFSSGILFTLLMVFIWHELGNTNYVDCRDRCLAAKSSWQLWPCLDKCRERHG